VFLNHFEPRGWDKREQKIRQKVVHQNFYQYQLLDLFLARQLKKFGRLDLGQM
jgi:hypothetical protein